MTLKLNGTTSGSVSLDAPATGSDVSFTLPGSVGTSGQLLSTNGAGVLSFVNGGKILQIVRATDTTDRTTSSTTYVDANISVTITPQKSDSAVLLLWTAPIEASTSPSFYQITTSANNTISSAEGLQKRTDGTYRDGVVLVGYATPATTSAITYKGRFRVVSGSVVIANSVVTGQLLAIEVAA